MCRHEKRTPGHRRKCGYQGCSGCLEGNCSRAVGGCRWLPSLEISTTANRRGYVDGQVSASHHGDARSRYGHHDDEDESGQIGHDDAGAVGGGRS